MFPSIRYNTQQLQNYLKTTSDFFSQAIQKYAKITAVVFTIFAAMTALFFIYRHYKGKKLDGEKSDIPSPINLHSPAKVVVDNIAEQEDQVRSKIQEIACLPLAPYSADRENIVYQSEDEIKGKGGVLLTKNCNFIGGDHYHGIVALPEKNGGYCLHLCPGGGNMSFTKDQIDQLMAEAIKELVKQKITITVITGFIGRHPGNTITNFQQWQAEQLANDTKPKPEI